MNPTLPYPTLPYPTPPYPTLQWGARCECEKRAQHDPAVRRTRAASRSVHQSAKFSDGTVPKGCLNEDRTGDFSRESMGCL